MKNTPSRIERLTETLGSVLSNLGDLFIVSILWLVCCIPVVTIGAATTGLYYATMRLVEKRGDSAARDFFKSFKENFAQSTITWLILLFIGAVLTFNFLFAGALSSTQVASAVAVISFVIAVFYLFVFNFVFPIIARFENSIFNMVKFSLIIAIRHLPSTIVIIILGLSPLVLGFVSIEVLVRGIIPVLLFLRGIIAYLQSFLFVRIFYNYYPSDVKIPGKEEDVE